MEKTNVQYLEFNGEKLPVHISHYALSRTFEDCGKSPDDIFNVKGNLGFNTDAETLLFYALEAGCRLKKRVFDFEKEDMKWILDENYLEFQKVYFKSFKFEDPDKVEQMNEGKKKETLKKK